MPYAHWITFIIRQAVQGMAPETLQELSGATTEFSAYDLSQLVRHAQPRAPHPCTHRPEVPKIAAEQDEIIRGVAESEEAQLEAEPDIELETNPSDNFDDDY